MDRRSFLSHTAAVAALATGRVACAQPARNRVHRIGIIGLGATADLAGPEPRSPTQRAFASGMRELGYVYGEHFVTEARGAEGKPERFPSLAADLVAAKVDVIVASGAALPALKDATSTIPIIMAATSDPVGQGLVQSLGRPGGNITGLSLQSIDTTGKRLELIKELVPGPAPVAVLWNAPAGEIWRATDEAARQRGWPLLSLQIRELGDVGGALKTAKDAGASALVVLASAILFPNRRHVAELAANSRLPAIYELRPYVEAGGLISYGPEINDVWRRSAVYVDKILKGASPADLPIEQPVTFELVINAKAARALGLTIPPSLLVRADEVIE